MRPELLLSILVPVLDEERELPRALGRLAGLSGRLEVIVVDGGSRDRSVEAACDHPLAPQVVRSAARGRGAQLNEGAKAACGEALLFLHADTSLPEDAYRQVAGALEDPRVAGGNFTLAFDGDDRFSRLAERIYAAQRRLGVYYGDSAVFVRTAAFRELGGFRNLPIMDDYDFVRRLEREMTTVRIDARAVTSSRRWREGRAGRTLALWLTIQTLYVVGVPPARLVRLYRRAR